MAEERDWLREEVLEFPKVSKAWEGSRSWIAGEEEEGEELRTEEAISATSPGHPEAISSIHQVLATWRPSAEVEKGFRSSFRSSTSLLGKELVDL